MPAPKGNKNRQKGLSPKNKKIEIRVTTEIKEMLESHKESSGETISELVERLIVSHFKK